MPILPEKTSGQTGKQLADMHFLPKHKVHRSACQRKPPYALVLPRRQKGLALVRKGQGGQRGLKSSYLQRLLILVKEVGEMRFVI
jgi:hypothetical protein